MRVLWVTPYTPIANGGGGAAHENELLRLAMRNHDIEILSADTPEGTVPLPVGDGSLPISGATWRVRHGGESRARFASQFVRAWPSYDHWITSDRARAMRDALAFHLERRPVDLVHFTSTVLLNLVDRASAPTAVLAFDVFSRQAHREAAIAPTPERRLRWRVEEQRLARWERRWLPRFDGVAAVSAVDAAALHDLSGQRVPVIPNPLPDAFFATPEVTRDTRTVTFVANLAYRPNVEAVDWLVDEIWPRVVEQVPDARVEIVGVDPVESVVAAVQRAGGSLFADVPDVRPHYWRAAVSVSPVRLGSGLRNKVLHSMACRAPLVATSASLEGIEAQHGRDVLVADDAGAFAHAVVDALLDRAAATERAGRAAALADQHRSEIVGEQFETWWRAAVDASTRRRGRAERRASSTRVVPPEGGTATVIVGTRDRTELLRRTLPSLAAAVAAAPGTELVIVEQGAGRAADLCRESGICARVLHDDGVGVSRARNIGARQARGSVVLFTDDDCDVPVTWVADHLRALRAPGAAASCGPVEGLSRFTITDESVVDRDPAERVAVHRLGSPPWRIGHSANLVVLRATFLDVGGFDERLGPGASRFMGEDADLIVRVLHAGGAVLSGTGAPVRHVEWRTAGQTRANLLAYERGAGAWIGKAVRADPRDGRRYLRARLSLLRTRVMTEPGVLADPVTVAGSLAAFGEGLWFGWRAGGWHR